MSVVTILPETCKHLKSNSSNTPTNSLKSMESIYSITPSSKFSALSRRKVNQKMRNPSLVPAVSEIKQRVMSARMLRMKQMQNQIGEAHHRIAELAAENRLLKSLHKRQDSALSKYISSNAELPKLLNSHAEEVRIWQERCRNLQHQNKELQQKLKQKDMIVLSVTDQNKHLLQLNKDKNLQERSVLQERVKDLEQRLIDKENEMKLLARRLQLEAKAFKTNLNMEQQKYRELLMKIEMSEFLLRNEKKSPKPTQKSMLRNRSPVNRLNSKSATTLTTTNGNGSEREHRSVATPILPPCDESKKSEEGIKTNSPCVNNNVKLVPDLKASVADEIDLTRNSIDKSEKLLKNEITDNDDLVISVKNGMHRARQQHTNPKVNNAKNSGNKKLTPLHMQKQENVKNEKKSSDDSEFSDDDFHFFSDHNGTKVAHNARDLLDHKMHITELENKMRQNSLDAKSYDIKTSDSSLSSHECDAKTQLQNDMHSFNDRGDSELVSLQREIRDSMLRRESILDEYCDTVVDKNSYYSHNTLVSNSTHTKVKKIEFAGGNKLPQPIPNNNHAKSNGSVVAGRPQHQLDEKKKVELLAALKRLEKNGSVDS